MDILNWSAVYNQNKIGYPIFSKLVQKSRHLWKTETRPLERQSEGQNIY